MKLEDHLKDSLLEILSCNDFKDCLLKEINDEVDLPMIGEKKESKLFKAIYKVILKTIEKQLE